MTLPLADDTSMASQSVRVKTKWASRSAVWTGFKESLSIHATALGMRRGVKPYVVAPIITAAVLLILLASTALGTLIRSLSAQFVEDQENIVGSFAMNYLSLFNRGEMGLFGAIALGICIASAIAAPIIPGTLSTSAIKPAYIVSMGLNRWHRFFDSLVSQLMSSVSLLELFILFGLTSIVTLDGGREKGLFLALAIWLLLNAVSIFALWVVEFFHRKFGSNTKAIISTGFISVIIAAVILDPNHGTTVFGLGDAFMAVMGNIQDYSWIQIVALSGVIAVIAAAVLFSAGAAFSRAIMLPENIVIKDADGVAKKDRFHIGTPLTRLVRGNRVWKMLLNTLLRSGDLMKPMAFVLMLGWAATIIVPDSSMVGSTFALTIPMIIGLSWGSNALGHLSGGGLWLNAQGEALKNAPYTIFTIQVITSLVLSLILWTPSLIAQLTNPETFVRMIVITVATSMVIARSATSKALSQPAPLHYGARAESTLSPTKTLEFMIRFSLFGGQLGVILGSVEAGVPVLAGVAGIVGAWQIMRLKYATMKWSQPEVRAKQLSLVSVDD